MRAKEGGEVDGFGVQYGGFKGGEVEGCGFLRAQASAPLFGFPLRLFLLGCLGFNLPGLRQGGGHQTGGDRHDAHPDDQHKEGEDLPPDCYRVHVAVAHRGKRHNRPPETVEYGGEGFRLGFVFKVVDARRGEVEHDKSDDKKQDDFLPHHPGGNGKPLKGPVVADHLQGAHQPQDPERPQGPPVQRAVQVEGQNGQQVDDTVKTEDIPQGFGGHIDPQQVFHRKNRHGKYFKNVEAVLYGRAQAGKRLNGVGDERE